MIDCIAGYHLNPWTCGIAKFNAILAKHLDVPVVGIRAVELGSHQPPAPVAEALGVHSARCARISTCGARRTSGQFELFLHAFDGTDDRAAARRRGGARLLRQQRALRASCSRCVRTSRSCSARARSSTRSGSSGPSCRCSPSAWRTRSACRSTAGCATCSTRPARAIRCTSRRRCTRTPASTARSSSGSRSCSRSSTGRSTSWATCPTRRSSTT